MSLVVAKNENRLQSPVMSDCVDFKSICHQNVHISGVAMLDQNFIIYPRTSNGFSVSRRNPV
jgi:hypothetical protein